MTVTYVQAGANVTSQLVNFNKQFFLNDTNVHLTRFSECTVGLYVEHCDTHDHSGDEHPEPDSRIRPGLRVPIA